MAIKNLEKMDIYNPTNYVNNSEPDIDADNLNKTENKLEETVAKANEIIDALKTLISTVQANSDNTVPSSSLAYAMQQEITKNKEDIATANSNLSQKANSSDLTNVSNVAAAANGKVELSGGPIKIIAYAGDGNWSFQQQYGDGVILSLGMNDTQIFYDYYDGKTWTRKWTK